MRRLILPTLAAIVLSSCQTIYRADPRGTAVLTRGQFKLPQRIDEFQRVYVKAFDGSGYDVGAGYNRYSSSYQAALTVFVLSTPSGKSPTREEAGSHFRRAAEEIRIVHPGAKVVSTSAFAGHGGTGMLSEYWFDGILAHRKQPVCSLLAVFRDKGRLVKYRLTGPAAQRRELKEALVRVVRALSATNREYATAPAGS